MMDASAPMSTAALSSGCPPQSTVSGAPSRAVDAIGAPAAGEQLLGDASGDLIIAVEAGQLHRAMAADQDVGELRAQDVLDIAEDAIVVARARVARLQVHGHDAAPVARAL